MSLALVSLGSNLGDRRRHLDAAVAALRQTDGIQLLAASGWHEAVAIGGPSGQGNFLNGALLLETSLAPRALLGRLQQIEAGAQRTREERWAARTLDLDLLLYDDVVLDEAELMVPHPRLALRRFVLETAAEIAPQMRHPLFGWTLAHLLDHLNQALPYLAITGVPGAGQSRLAHALARQTSARLLERGNDQAEPANDLLAAFSASLEECRRLLIAADWSPSTPLTVSSFWFDELLALGVALSPPDLARLEQHWQALREDIVQPKLIVWLDAPADWFWQQPTGSRLLQGLRSRLERTFYEQARAALERQLHRPEVGPWLRLDADDFPASLSECLAAVEAMR